jgi:hypothetical protein
VETGARTVAVVLKRPRKFFVQVHRCQSTRIGIPAVPPDAVDTFDWLVPPREDTPCALIFDQCRPDRVKDSGGASWC